MKTRSHQAPGRSTGAESNGDDVLLVTVLKDVSDEAHVLRCEDALHDQLDHVQVDRSGVPLLCTILPNESPS